MGEAKNLVAEWREKAAQRAAERAALIQSVAVDFAGFTGRAHRLDLMGYARAGRMPQYLCTAMFAAVKGDASEKRKADLTPEELSEWLGFQCIAFCDMMDEPKFTASDVFTDDEISYAEFVVSCPDVVEAGVQWQLSGCPNIPVPVEGGEVSVADLENFPHSGAGASSTQLGIGGQNVWWETQPTPRHIM